MSTRKEEERNEKIIRGLMKLPPNRRCINCNSLGPQYVCTNFWTFICITCSGIHREFTHRVKSVSMAKFTSQEVEALQRGGNQRARETYLKECDSRQKLPDSSNVDRVREFIKNAYVDRRYAGGMTSDKPPRDMQNLRNREEDTRRASSYHSYSQSPPYEYQYEDRRYGKQAPVLTRRPGSDRSLYEGKVSSFIYSPGRVGEQMYEDRFANEGSGSRVSDYSVSSASDPSRSYTQSPTFHQDAGFSSPPIHPVRDVFIGDVQRQKLSTYPEANARRDADGIPHPRRTSSSGSFGSFDSNSMSLKSVNSGSLIDIISEPGQSAGPQQDVISSFPTLPRSSVSADAVSLDLFNTPPLQQSGTSSTPSTNLFQSPVSLSAPSTDLFQPARTSSASPIDLFAEITYQHSSTTSVEQRSAKVSFPENEGWATFDVPHCVTHFSETKNVPFANMPSDDGPFVGNADNISSTNSIMQWPPVQDFTANEPFSLISSNWHGSMLEVQASAGPTKMRPWNAFENSVGTFFQTSSENLPQKIEPQVPTPELPSTSDQYMSSKVSEDSSKDRSQRASLEVKSSPSSIPFNDDIRGSSLTSPVPPSMSGLPSIASDRKSTNPFDLPYDSDLEPNNMFLEDMHSLQAALPNPQLPPAFLGGWYAHNSPQGGLPYIAGQALNAQLPNNISSQSTVASLGGNPFA